MHLLKLLFLFSAIQGLLLLVALFLRKEKKPTINISFLLLIFLLTFTLISKYFFNNKNYAALPHIWYFIDTIAFFFSFLWFKTLQRSFNISSNSFKDYVLLLFLMLPHTLFLVRILFTSISDFGLLTKTYWFKLSYYIFAFTVFITNALFLIKAYQIIKKQKTNLNFVTIIQHCLTLIFLIGCCLFLVIAINSKNTFDAFFIYNIMYVLVSFTVFALTFVCLIKPEYYYFIYRVFKSEDNRQLKIVSNAIKEFLNEEKAFLNPVFNLKKLSEDIGYNTSLTSKAINTELNSSFSDLINEYRANYFIQLATKKDNQQFTHWALAQTAGFGNKASFYKHFKRITGQTPKSYFSVN